MIDTLSPFAPIQTSRLVIRRFKLTDAPTLSAYRNDPGVARFQGWAPAGEAEISQLVTQFADGDRPKAGSWFQVAVEEKATGMHVGDCGIRLRGEEPRQAVIGYTIARAAQGKGYATEAVAAVLDYLFDVVGVHRVMADALAANVRSVRLMERLGFRREGHLREMEWFEDRWADLLIYAILRREWDQRDAPVDLHPD